MVNDTNQFSFLYCLLQKLLGFPSRSTLDDYEKDRKFQLGMSDDVVMQAATEYQNNLVVESSDEARVRRYEIYLYIVTV